MTTLVFTQAILLWRIADYLEPQEAWVLTRAVKFQPNVRTYWKYRSARELGWSEEELEARMRLTGFGPVALIIVGLSKRRTISGSERFISSSLLRFREMTLQTKEKTNLTSEPLWPVSRFPGQPDPVLLSHILSLPIQQEEVPKESLRKYELFSRLNPPILVEILLRSTRTTRLRSLLTSSTEWVTGLTPRDRGFALLIAVNEGQLNLADYLLSNFAVHPTLETKASLIIAAYRGYSGIISFFLASGIGSVHTTVHSAAWGQQRRLAIGLIQEGRRIRPYATSLWVDYLIGSIKGNHFIQFIAGLIEWTLEHPKEVERVFGVGNRILPPVEFSRLITSAVLFDRPRFLGFLLDLIRPDSLLDTCYLQTPNPQCYLMRLATKNGQIEVLAHLMRTGFDRQAGIEEAKRTKKNDLLRMLECFR